MVMRMQGTIRGKQIELDRETGLPSGSVVTVNIEPRSLTLEEKRRMVDALCGTWAGDASILSIFAEIERQRSITMPRETSFDVAS